MAKKSSVQVNITIPLEWKQSDIDMIAKARAWAVKAHAGQKDKAGKDYFKAHVTVVAEGVKGDPIAEAVAFLHDTVEDTSVTIEDIRTGFPKKVADTVSTLTHSKGISYAEYLWYIQQNSIAVKVKLSDLRSNMDLTRLPHTPTERDLERTRKYKRAYTILSSREGISAVNPYALYDYLLANNCAAADDFTNDDEDDSTIKFDGTVDEFRQELANRVLITLSLAFEHEFINFTEQTGISRAQYEILAAEYIAHAEDDGSKVSEMFKGDSSEKHKSKGWNSASTKNKRS